MAQVFNCQRVRGSIGGAVAVDQHKLICVYFDFIFDAFQQLGHYSSFAYPR